MIFYFLKKSTPVLDENGNQLGLDLIYAGQKIPTMEEAIIEYQHLFNEPSVGLKTITYDDLMKIVDQLQVANNWQSTIEQELNK